MTSERGPTPVSAVLAQVLEKYGVQGRIQQLGALDDWPDVVGEQLARVTKVRGMDETALFVEVRSSAWLMELSMMKEDFLERVNERLGGAPLEKIVFVLAETA